MRKTQIIQCKICNKSWSSAFFGQHLKKAHTMISDDYAKLYGEYRVNQLKCASVKAKSDVLFHCKECSGSSELYTDRLLSFHLNLKHPTITKEQYVIKHILNGHIPKCKCGCGEMVKILHYTGEIHRDYVSSSHAPNGMTGKTHNIDSKLKMSNSASTRITNAHENNIILPWHSENAIKKRGKTYSQNLMSQKFEKFNITILSTYEEQQSDLFKFKCNKCNSEYTQFHNSYFLCRQCHPRIRSHKETEVLHFLENELGISSIIQNYRKLFQGTFELDFYLPDYQIGIEFNGLFWHSEVGGNKDRKYHLNKQIACREKGIRLIQIFEDDWNDNRELIKLKLRHILKLNNLPKIYARQLNISNVPELDKREFLIQNHIQGNDVSSIRLGCYSKSGELMSLMTFSSPNVNKGNKTPATGVYELSRFTSNSKTRCIGSFSKLFQYFVKNYSPSKIITYADLCWSVDTDNVYLNTGFELSHVTPPNYWYTNDYKHRLHRFNFTKHKLIQNGYDARKTEWDIMKECKYDRIWDCGHLCYKWIPK